jgi:uncharacterized membrane protein (DUF373 family)
MFETFSEVPPKFRALVAQLVALLRLIEDAIYLAIAGALITAAVALLLSAAIDFYSTLMGHLRDNALRLLDSLLLVLMLVEILHTVGISLRQHALTAEPFLMVGLIAVIRRVLVITTEQAQLTSSPAVFTLTLWELLLLGFLIVILVTAIFILRQRPAP